MKNSTPLVSVIVPLFNREKFLPQLFKSLKEQTYCNFELILIDDGSVDNTQTWLAANKHILSQNIIYAKQENAGPYSARNHGLSLATGKYIAFQDSDDEWPDYHLDEFVVALEANNDIDWIFGSLQRINHKTGKLVEASNFYNIQGQRHKFVSLKTEKRAHINVIEDDTAAAIAVQHCVPGSTQCAMIRKSLFDDNIFDPSYRTAYDRFFAIKCVLLGFGFAYVDKIHQIYHIHDEHISLVDGAEPAKLNRSAVTMVRGYQQLLNLCNTPMEKKAAHKRLAEVNAWELAHSFQLLHQYKQSTVAMYKAVTHYPYDWRYFKTFCASLIRLLVNTAKKQLFQKH
jgi:glycosyltransferase involved in cell wall biosynthesis